MQVKVTIKGVTPLLMNAFNDAEAMENGTSKVQIGDRGSPRDIAAKKVYRDEFGVVMIPGPNVFACLISAGKFHKVGKSKVTTQKTSLIPAGLTVVELALPLDKQTFEVDSRSVVIPATGGRVMCHRPRFDAWELAFTLDVDMEMFDLKFVRALIDDAGKRIGLGDFRPERKGPFGRFVVSKWMEK